MECPYKCEKYVASSIVDSELAQIGVLVFIGVLGEITTGQ